MAQRKCYNCGAPGHFASGCPEIVFSAELGTGGDGRPPWCGQCDKRTRLVFDPDADTASRCPDCHPEKDLPAQFRICKCGDVIYKWDQTECGSHQAIGKQSQKAGI